MFNDFNVDTEGYFSSDLKRGWVGFLMYCYILRLKSVCCVSERREKIIKIAKSKSIKGNKPRDRTMSVF